MNEGLTLKIEEQLLTSFQKLSVREKLIPHPGWLAYINREILTLSRIADILSRNGNSIFSILCNVSIERGLTEEEVSSLEKLFRQYFGNILSKFKICNNLIVKTKENIIFIPVNGLYTAVILSLTRGKKDSYQCKVNIAGLGRIVAGKSEDEDFGKWDEILAIDIDGKSLGKFHGHAGEFYPCSFHDNVETLRNRIINKKAWPIQADIDVSYGCTSNCTFCFANDYIKDKFKGRRLNTELVLKLIRELAEGGTKMIRFTGGGEPFTHKGIREMISLANNLGMQTAILTNGDLLDEEMAKFLVDMSTYVRISVNSASNETRLKIHRPKNSEYNFDNLIKNIRCLIKYRGEKRKQSGRNAGKLIGATFLVDVNNYREIYEVAWILKAEGVDHLSFRRILGITHAVHFTEEQEQEIYRQFDRIQKELADENFIVFFPTRPLTDKGLKPSEHFSKCLSSTHRAIIDINKDPAKATIVPCGRNRGAGLHEGGIVFGIYDGSVPFRHIWMDQQMLQVLEKLPESCQYCIDRGTNVVLGKMRDVLMRSPSARFYKFTGKPRILSNERTQNKII